MSLLLNMCRTCTEKDCSDRNLPIARECNNNIHNYYEINTGLYKYYVSVGTGESKYKLDVNDKIIARRIDDFSRN